MPLPRPVNDNSSRIIFIKFEGDIAKGLVNLDELYSVFIAIHEIMIMEDPYACINGIIYILDMKDVTIGIFTPKFVIKAAHFIEHSLPFYIRSAHFINVPQQFHNCIETMHTIYSEKFAQRVYKLFVD